MQQSKGFTLIELLVVMALIGILIAGLVSAITNHEKNAAIVATKGAIGTIDGAVKVYRDFWGYLPKSDTAAAYSADWFNHLVVENNADILTNHEGKQWEGSIRMSEWKFDYYGSSGAYRPYDGFLQEIRYYHSRDHQPTIDLVTDALLYDFPATRSTPSGKSMYLIISKGVDEEWDLVPANYNSKMDEGEVNYDNITQAHR